MKNKYQAWGDMIQRCFNPKNARYKDYGGRGITVCDRWRKFENFLADMGERPPDRPILDRYPDPNGNYEPGNVRWATEAESARNKRSNHLVTYDGRTQCVADWAKEKAIDERTLRKRLKRWSAEDALTIPVGTKIRQRNLRGQFLPRKKETENE